MGLNTIQKQPVTNAGFTQSIASATLPDIIYIQLAANLVLAADVSFETSDTPTDGQSVVYVIDGGNGSVDLSGQTFQLHGVNIEKNQLQAGLLFYITSDGTGWQTPIILSSQNFAAPTPSLDGKYLVDETVDLLKLETGAAGNLIMYNGGGNASSKTMSGDGTIDPAGAFFITNNVILNAHINTGAAIARTKLASGTTSHVLINDGSGVMSSEAQLAKSRGGFGASVAAATGFTKWASGTLDISSIVDSRDYQVSFESGEVGANNTYTLGFACTLTPTNCSAFVLKAIAATDDAVITLKKNGVAIASGTITFALSSAQNAAGVFGGFSATNFVAGDTISLVSSKPTVGGKVNVTLQFTRTS